MSRARSTENAEAHTTGGLEERIRYRPSRAFYSRYSNTLSQGGHVIHPNEVLGELREPARELREHIPDVIGAYADMQRAAMADGALPGKVKELIALAVAVTRQCDGCIASHARGAARKGATEPEVADALAIAVILNGGPGTVWAPRALAAFREIAGPPES